MVRDEKDLGHSAALLVLTFLVLSSGSLPAETGPHRLLLEEATDATAVEQGVASAVAGAVAKLESLECRKVFSEFRDRRGRTLEENLGSLGLSPATYLPRVLYYDGYGYSRCDVRTTIASTSPGSRAVFICSPQFLSTQRRKPELAAVLIIHEELHSLGLEEDPPTSKQITSAVIARCGL
jgi:hypothetical protein